MHTADVAPSPAAIPPLRVYTFRPCLPAQMFSNGVDKGDARQAITVPTAKRSGCRHGDTAISARAPLRGVIPTAHPRFVHASVRRVAEQI